MLPRETPPMTQPQTSSFPFGPSSPAVAATLRSPAIEAIDALLAQIADSEADVWFGGLSERIVAIPGAEVLTGQDDDASFFAI